MLSRTRIVESPAAFILIYKNTVPRIILITFLYLILEDKMQLVGEIGLVL
jgi:hypothetical protein